MILDENSNGLVLHTGDKSRELRVALTPEQELLFRLAAVVIDQVNTSLANEVERCICCRDHSKKFCDSHRRRRDDLIFLDELAKQVFGDSWAKAGQEKP